MSVKEAVWERDHHRCIVCGSPYGMPNAHIISRARGGLGVEKNIVTLCQECHRRYDQSTKEDHEKIKAIINERMLRIYGEIKESEVTYGNRPNQ